MPVFVWIVLAAVLAFGVMRLMGRRATREAERKTRADKRAKLAADDARAIKRALAARR